MASVRAVQAALDLCDKVPAWFRELTADARVERTLLYEAALEDLSDGDVLAASKLAVKRCKFFPVPAELREFVQPKVSAEAAMAREASTAYEAILARYEQGEPIHYREIAEQYGPAAAEAFNAAGASSAFTWCEPGRDAAFRLKRFVDAYLEQGQAQASEQAALGAGATPRPALTRGEASAAVGKLRGLLESVDSLVQGEVR